MGMSRSPSARKSYATTEALAARAAHYGLLDVEVRALIDMAYPLSWISSERCLDILKRALQSTQTLYWAAPQAALRGL
jgi:hypothetical protein